MMAPTLTHVHGGNKLVTPSPLQQQQQQQHRHSISITHTKGLLNGPGQNNCFLNSAVQVLWHLDIFRRSFRELTGHACMAESCIFCALKELFAQFQYSHESALPPDALRRALAETFFNQQRFQLGFMDDAAECFENILLRIHFHIANNESEDMCNARHCIPHQKFAMTLVEQGVCHSCGATSEPLPFTQMVHYVTSSTLCAQAKLNRESGNFNHDFGQLLRKAGGMGEIRDCPSACGAKIQIQRTLINHPEIVSIGIVWDSERPTLEHIMDVFHTVGATIRLQNVFHSVVDDRWVGSTVHQLVGIVTYYGKHYSTFFFHTKLRVWIYFDDATVREIGPRWEQVVEKCRRGHFQPLLLLYADPHGNSVATDSAPKTVTYVQGRLGKDNQGYNLLEKTCANQRDTLASTLRRALTPNPEKQLDCSTDVIPRRAITPSPEIRNRNEPCLNDSNYLHDKSSQYVYGALVKTLEQQQPVVHHKQQLASCRLPYEHDQYNRSSSSAPPVGRGHDNIPPNINSIYNGELLQNFLQRKGIDNQMLTGKRLFENKNALRANGYFNNCDVIDGYKVGDRLATQQQLACHQGRAVADGGSGGGLQKDVNKEGIYISRKAVENVLNYQKVQRQRCNSTESGCSIARSRNSDSSLESFENALRIRSHYNLGPGDVKVEPFVENVGMTSNGNSNAPRCRDSGNWSGDRNSASSTSSASNENPYYYIMPGSNKRSTNGIRSSCAKPPSENVSNHPLMSHDTGYDSFSLSSNDSFPLSLAKHNQQLAQIPENPAQKQFYSVSAGPKTQMEFIDECHLLCMDADKFLDKSVEHENNGDLEGAISMCNAAAAKARAAMDAPYSNPQILMFARMKHNSCIMRARTLHRRMLVRQDSLSSHDSSSTGTDGDSPHKSDAPSICHSRQSSRDSTRSRSGGGNHSRQSSRDGTAGGVTTTSASAAVTTSHSRQGSKDTTSPSSHNRQNSQDALDKKRIELYGTLPKRATKKKMEKDREVLCLPTDESPLNVSGPVSSDVVRRDTRIPQRVNPYAMQNPNVLQQQQQQHVDVSKSKIGGASMSNSNKMNVTGQYGCAFVAERTCRLSGDVVTKPSTLQRTNSIPSSFHCKELANSHSCTDVSGGKDEELPDEGGKSGVAKVGKKQHKIRRKLLMGGLIRRKNRSMPDLREGGSSPAAQTTSSERCVDDSCVKQQQQLPTHLLSESSPAYQNGASLSCQNLYYAASQRHASKIPPPPPVRRTSQLTTRSQSHSSLVSNARQDNGRGSSKSFGFPLPVEPPALPPTYAASKLTTTSRNCVPQQSVAHPTVNYSSSIHQHHLPPAFNQITTQADVHHHHEQTCNDHVLSSSSRSTSNLVRTMSCRGPTTTNKQQQQQVQQRASSGNISTRSSTALSSPLPPPPPPFSPVHCDSESAVAASRQKTDCEPPASGSSEGLCEPPSNAAVEVSGEGIGGGLLEQLLLKRQQLLQNPKKVPDGKGQQQQSTKCDVGWLQELQVKQQQMLSKKKVTGGDANVDRFSKSNHDVESASGANWIGHAKASDEVARRSQLHAGKEKSLPPASSEVEESRPMVAADDNYKQKSVRDLASKFEKKINLPPTAAATTTQPQRKECCEVTQGDVPDGAGLKNNRTSLVSFCSPMEIESKSSPMPKHVVMEQMTNDCYNQGLVSHFNHSNNKPDGIGEQSSHWSADPYSTYAGSSSCSGNPQPKSHNGDSRLSFESGSGDQSVPVCGQTLSTGNNNRCYSSSGMTPVQCNGVQHVKLPEKQLASQPTMSSNVLLASSATRSPAPNDDSKWKRSYALTSSSNGYTELSYVGTNSYSQASNSSGVVRPVTNGNYYKGHLGMIGSAAAAGRDQLPENFNTAGNAMDVTDHHPHHYSGNKTIPKKKKSVTFSDQIALVACAEDNEGFSLLNPLLEKVLGKPGGVQVSHPVNSRLPTKPPAASASPTVSQQQMYSQLPTCNSNSAVVNGDMSSSTCQQQQQNGDKCGGGLAHPQRSAIPTYTQKRTVSSSSTSSSSYEVPCYLCRKKSVLPPVVYCRDCDFYMSRFKPKN